MHARGCGASARKTKNGRGRGTIVADLHPRSPRVLLESNAGRNAGNELYQVTYNSWADVLSNTIAAQGFLPLDINPLFSVGGFGALAFPRTDPQPTPVPEPAALALLVLGLSWLAATRRRSS